MADASPRWVALLYSIVLAPGRRVNMAELRAVATGLGLADPRTVVSTGNLVFDADAPDAAVLEARLEPAFVARFGRPVAIIVRPAAAWRRMVAANPFPEASAAEPALVAVRVMRVPLDAAVADRLEPYRAEGEKVAVAAGDLWLHLPRGFAASRLAAAVTPARFGTGTFRNWNTVRRISDMLES